MLSCVTQTEIDALLHGPALKKYSIILWVCQGGVLLACMSESVGSSGTGITDSCELPCGCWELNLGPLQEE